MSRGGGDERRAKGEILEKKSVCGSVLITAKRLGSKFLLSDVCARVCDVYVILSVLFRADLFYYSFS